MTSASLLAFLAGRSAVDSLGELTSRVDVSDATKLGNGASGEVLLAHEQGSRRQLAIKVMSLVHSPSREANICREASVMHKLRGGDECFAQLVDVLVCRHQLPHVAGPPPYLCLVMEYISNARSLSSIIRKGGAQPELATNIGAQLARALAQMHNHGFVHRDVWSENVLVKDSGRVVLIDFGSATSCDSGPDCDVELNIPYVSPEASKKMRQHPGDDCWSLGLVMSEIVTGRFIMDRLGTSGCPVHFKPDVLSALISDVSARNSVLGEVCKRLLEHDVAQRMSMSGVLSCLTTPHGLLPFSSMGFLLVGSCSTSLTRSPSFPSSSGSTTAGVSSVVSSEVSSRSPSPPPAVGPPRCSPLQPSVLHQQRKLAALSLSC